MTAPTAPPAIAPMIVAYILGVAFSLDAFTPGPDTYTGSVIVTMQSATPGAAVFWTTDGSEPTQAWARAFDCSKACDARSQPTIAESSRLGSCPRQFVTVVSFRAGRLHFG